MTPKQKILIFQIGSLGDTVISMPCYRDIIRRHPNSERHILTNFSIGQKMVQAEAMLKPGALIDDVLRYPMPLRGWRNVRDLFKLIRSHRFDVLYYLCPEKRLSNLLRHYLFFKSCGIGIIRGVPWSKDLRYPRKLENGRIWESEASRLLRTIGARTTAGPPAFEDRSLSLSDEERATANQLLAETPGLASFIAISVGGKVPIKDWGDANWMKVLSDISERNPGLGAVFVGSADERPRNELLADAWAGPRLNSCGRMTPRETAAIIERADLYLGHDTGTLHLAAAVGTPVIGIFSARDVPGKWFSDRPGDHFFYNRTPCFSCGLTQIDTCPNQMACMTRHDPAEIAARTSAMLAS